MANDFIEELRRKAKKGIEQDEQELAKQTAGIANDELDVGDDHFLKMLEQTFNPKSREREEK